MADPFQMLFDALTHRGDDSSSSDLSEPSLSVDNDANIANGSSLSTSPDEEIIRCRGRKHPSSRNKPVNSNPSARREEMLLALATRKSPRKPSGPVVDYASYFFRSPTPKKTPQSSTGNTPKKELSPALLKARMNFRKRLSLNPDSNSSSSSPRGSQSPSLMSSGNRVEVSQPKKSSLKNTVTPHQHPKSEDVK
jgi:hypothetical protein